MITFSGSLHTITITTTTNGIGTKRKSGKGLPEGSDGKGGEFIRLLVLSCQKDAPCTQLLFSSHFLEIMVVADNAAIASQPAVNAEQKKKKVRAVFSAFFALSLLTFPLIIMICSEADPSHACVLGSREGNDRILFNYFRKDFTSWVVFPFTMPSLLSLATLDFSIFIL